MTEQELLSRCGAMNSPDIMCEALCEFLRSQGFEDSTRIIRRLNDWAEGRGHEMHDLEGDVIIGLEARISHLEKTLEAAANRFREYEGSHREKRTADGDAKAQRNAEMAELCEKAIEADGG